jgi:hypothetical protein
LPTLAGFCLKLNLLVDRDDAAIRDFYRRCGHGGERIFLMDKWLA